MLKSFTHSQRRWSLSALAALGLLLVLVFTSEKVETNFYSFVFWGEELMSLKPALGAFFFFFISCLSALLAFASSLVLIPSALLAWGALGTFFLLWAGWLAGAAIAYGAGSRLARPLFSSWGREQKIAHYQQFVSREANFWLVLLFCLAVPSEIPGYVFGVLRYPFGRFMAAIAVSEALYAAGVLLAAQNLLRQDFFSTAGTILAIFAFTGLTSFLFIRLRRKRA